MLARFLQYITENGLFRPDERVLVAVSGGMDSVVLIHLFHQANLPFAVAHCNFTLRGEESDADAQFVKKLAKKYKVPFYGETFDTLTFAGQEKVSVQMAARILRYEWLEQIRHSAGCAYLATAHHVNDLIETVLLNLTRGTGIAGLHGIQAKRGRVIRPLLFASREEIFAYVVEHQIAWREDSSNESTKYQRNRIRHQVIPVLKEINPSLESTWQQTVEKIAAVERVFIREAERLRSVAVRQAEDVCYIRIESVVNESDSLITLFYLLESYNFHYDQVKEIVQSASSESGKQFESPTHVLVKDRTEWIITPKSLTHFGSAYIGNDQAEFRNDWLHLQFESIPIDQFTLDTSAAVACLDADALQFPLKLRTWKAGDWFCPLGMAGKKKLSDFMIDAKIPINLKDRIWVLLSSDSVAWVVGYRIDDRFKVTTKTTRVLKIRSNKMTQRP